MLGKVEKVTAKSFRKEVLRAPGVVLVDFYADWCGPCHQMAPIFEELASAYAGKMKFTKVNVDHAPQIAANYRVSGIPTLGFFKDGQLIHAVTGARPRAALEAEIERVLAAVGE